MSKYGNMHFKVIIAGRVRVIQSYVNAGMVQYVANFQNSSHIVVGRSVESLRQPTRVRDNGVKTIVVGGRKEHHHHVQPWHVISIHNRTHGLSTIRAKYVQVMQTTRLMVSVRIRASKRVVSYEVPGGFAMSV
jgi:hypothetical protein